MEKLQKLAAFIIDTEACKSIYGGQNDKKKKKKKGAVASDKTDTAKDDHFKKKS
ncbi:hypothetical protein GJU39_00165 [Pedobacter petrophilus]|uniref:Uncharacterized protein n=1 Tax=Pedobacter petrophilus TaxID=1908241 RepID=A0A7K0FS96_9SPHI|nr:hypothetical protein [Pedobacter petrophilus]MRX74485.1 hypothetical protein [Pedobacter petrophilus]